MKLIHTADWHLGKSLLGKSLLPDQQDFLDRIFLPLLKEERPDLVLLCGDVFDRAVAPVEAIRLFDSVLMELHALSIPLAVIAGNHDGADRMAVGAGLLRLGGVYIFSGLQEVLSPVTFSFSGERLCLYPLPYCEPVQIRQFLNREDLRGFQDSYSALLSGLQDALDPGAIHLLMAHCFVAGSTVSASETPVYVGGTGEVSAQTFSGFDAVALGHLHAPQRAGSNGWYSGSPLKYSFDEANQKKSVTIWETGEAGLTRRTVSYSPLHDVRVVRGRFQELLEQARAQSTQDYLFAELTDGSPVYLPMDRLREYWPNLLGLNSEWLSGGSIQGENHALREQLVHHRTDDRMILQAFFEQICGQEADENDWLLFLQAMREIEEETP